jgi:hypothetical protein
VVRRILAGEWGTCGAAVCPAGPGRARRAVRRAAVGDGNDACKLALWPCAAGGLSVCPPISVPQPAASAGAVLPVCVDGGAQGTEQRSRAVNVLCCKAFTEASLLCNKPHAQAILQRTACTMTLSDVECKASRHASQSIREVASCAFTCSNAQRPWQREWKGMSKRSDPSKLHSLRHSIKHPSGFTNSASCGAAGASSACTAAHSILHCSTCAT